MKKLCLILVFCIVISVCESRFKQKEASYDDEEYFEATSVNGQSQAWTAATIPVSEDTGAVSGISLDHDDKLLWIFHRGSHTWDEETFDRHERYKKSRSHSIPETTLRGLNLETKKVEKEFGADQFFMPHGLTIDSKGNFWLTDVALHQIFRYPRNATKPDLVLGKRFSPGRSRSRFCKPTSVAVMADGSFFVADGYCNRRVVYFSPKGEYVREWSGEEDGLQLNVPHKLTLIEDEGVLCVSDRENNRAVCFSISEKSFGKIRGEIGGNWPIGRVYSTGFLRAANSMAVVTEDDEGQSAIRLFDQKGELVDSFEAEDFNNAHDLTTRRGVSEMFVATLQPPKIWQLNWTEKTISSN